MKTETYGVRSYQSKKKRQQEQEDVRRGPWTLDEDTLLNQCVRRHGEGRWNLLAKSAGLKRTGKSCRLRWLNYLKPDIKRGNLSPQEQLLILELHSKWGNRWSKIAAHLPGRTDNEIKNYWRTRVQRQARQMNMESNSQSFMDAIRCFYMPRVVQKIEQSSTSTCSTMKSDPLSSHSPTKFSDNIRPSDLTVKTITSCSKNNSLSISDISEITHQPTESSADCNSTRITTVNFWGSSLVKEECQLVDSSSYDIGMPAMSTFSDCHMAEHDWFGHCVADDDIWELGELWQFRN